MKDNKLTKYNTNRPKIGQEIIYKGETYGLVTYVEDALCYVKPYKGGESLPFIWCFPEGLNILHDWPTKQLGRNNEPR